MSPALNIFVSFSHTPLIIYRREKQAMKFITTATLLLSAGAALGKEGRIEFGRSKPIATLEVDRQLGGKGGKSSKRDDKAGKYSSKSNKSSHSSSKSMKSSHIQHVSAPESTPVSSNSRDSRDIKLAEIDFGVEEVAEGGVEEVAEADNRDGSDDNRIKSTSQENSSFHGSLFDGANLSTPSSSPLGTGVPIAGQDDFFSRTNSDTDEETRTNFLEIEDNGDYSGLRTQNMVVGIASLFALLAAIVGVAVMRKRRANADNENNILDSVEIAPVVTAVRPNRRPPSNSIVNPVDDTDYSCDLFGFKDCLA